MQKAQQPLRFVSAHHVGTTVLRCGLFCLVALVSLTTTGCAATLPSSAPASSPQQQPASATTASVSSDSEFIEKSFDWTYWRFDEFTWHWSLKIPTSLYQHYKEKPRPRTKNYSVYATDEGDTEIIADLAHTLVQQADELGLDDYEKIHFIATFVQKLAYTSDVETTGFDDYARYPIETLVEEGGDCEDTAILLGKIMTILDYDVVLVRLPTHIALGVLEDEKFSGTYYPYHDKRYFYLETTGEAGRIGMVPEEYKGTLAYIFDFSPWPVIEHHWTGQRQDDTYSLQVTIENSGTATAEDCCVLAGFDAGEERIWNSTRSQTFSLAPDDKIQIDMTLPLPAEEHTRVLVFILRNEKAMDKSYSAWFDE